MPHVAWRPLMVGAASFVLPPLRVSHKPGGTIDAEHCYALFMRHYSWLRRFLPEPGVPRMVVELGPGNSLGVGLAALLAGAERYVALDVGEHRADARDRAILDRLIELFRARAPAPIEGPHARTFPLPADTAFPDEIAARLEVGMTEERLARLRSELEAGGGEMVRYVAPWHDVSCLEAGSVDWLLSHSVLEHVEDLEAIYGAMGRWVAPGGMMTHLIDFWSHDLTQEWNGHWAIEPRTWRLIYGRRPYLLNRAPRAEHLRLLEESGFVLRREIVERRSDGLLPRDFADPFRRLGDEDARTRMMFVVVARAGRS